MNIADFIYIALFVGLLIAVTPFLGRWIALVFGDKWSCFLRGGPGCSGVMSDGSIRNDAISVCWCLKPFIKIERLIYKSCGINPEKEMSWKVYTLALLAFNGIGFMTVLALQLLQGYLPLNPQGAEMVPLSVAVNTAVSFITNTNWQAYSGEATLSYLSQMAGLGVQNFLSAATGLAVLVALSRGFRRKSAATLGNFWTDLVRSTLYILLPIAFLLAVALVSQGVVMSFSPSVNAVTVEGTEQVIPLGPAASQVSIKQLGSNGGGFFGVNSAHPFENATPLSNFLEAFALLCIPSACVYGFGALVGARRHAIVVFAVMLLFFVSALGLSLWSEYASPDATVLAMEGKETRLGITPSIVWANATTVSSNGAVNAMHSSLSPMAGGIVLFNMMLGEIIFGGVGSGMYGMVAMIVLTVFLAGLMVGRTPEYLGKKIEAFDVRMAACAVLIPCASVLFFSALSMTMASGQSAVGNAGPHAFSEILYAWTSMSNNNGSAFGSLTATGGLFTWGGSIAMLIGRFGVIVPVLAFAGNLAAKKIVPSSSGTFPVDKPLFAVLLTAVILIVGALNYFPALVLGPVLEQLLLIGGNSF